MQSAARFSLENGDCKLASPGSDVYISRSAVQRASSQDRDPAVEWKATPRYRPNGETGRRMGLKIPRS